MLKINLLVLGQFGRLGGGGSDYAAFVQHVGIPSADLSFGKGNGPNLFVTTLLP